MACGTPCLRSNDSKTEVLDGINGELFNPLDHSEFIGKCISLLVNQDLLICMRLNADHMSKINIPGIMQLK